jgi:hypothetical protein
VLHVDVNVFKRKKRRLSVDEVRIRHLNKLARYRYSDGNGDYILPDDAQGRAIAAAIVTHQRYKPAQWLFKFCNERAPWLDPDEIDRKTLRPQKADALGQELGISGHLRDRLGLYSIGSCDQTRAERAAAAKARKRQRDRVRKRLQRNRQPRATYLAEHSISRTKPWEAEGIHKRTWERRRARAAASVSPRNSLSTSDTLATSVGNTPVPRVIWPSFSRPGMALPPLAPSSRLSPAVGVVYTELAYLVHLGDCTAGVLADGERHGGDRV